MIFYHGTSEANAKKIEQEGFKLGIPSKWHVKPKKGFVYFSTAYAPFYAMARGEGKLALIKVDIAEDDLFPEDDFLMSAIGLPEYTEKDLEGVSLYTNKKFWKQSLDYLGNVATTPDKVKILGVTYFEGKDLIWKCDPAICHMNFVLMGDYYNKLTEHIFEGKPIKEFPLTEGMPMSKESDGYE